MESDEIKKTEGGTFYIKSNQNDSILLDVNFSSKQCVANTLAHFAFAALAAALKQWSHTLAKRKSKSSSVTCVVCGDGKEKPQQSREESIF